ncbi:E3 ubiquitin- ligase NRDP1 [Paramuricea clavata]|uniref:E3 ubiquitin- ligase NRDP1 n=1 Tax=Paramuricea clavata TaxID=317549 RepID=A0A6S7H1W0_PARCT|nr:E3 ubiquitin- ligase NRDP1 [Paramuricea clavata]
MASLPAEEKYGYEDSRFEKAVDAHFHCSICYNVLKEPMMCSNNEHIFCRGCITEHLTVNSHTCPECNEDLTIETLRRAPRLVNNYLSELKINCSYSSRGCSEFIRLEEVDSHVENCGFAPVECSNEECGMVINKRELIHHESTVCEYRKVKCHSCQKLEQDIEEMKEDVEEMKKKMASKVDVDQVKALMVQMFEKLRFLENTIQISSAINHASNALTEDILVAGGWGKGVKRLKSVERFSWKNNVWRRVSWMNNDRAGATSFVYESRVFVAGGCDSDVIEVLNLNNNYLQWGELVATLPYYCVRLLSVIYQNRVIFFCTCDETATVDSCVEFCLTEPYTYKELCSMPEPARKHYRVVAFEHKVLIFGGKSGVQILDDVLEFDLTTNTFKAMPPLPCALQEMATVRWGDQAILIGGLDKDGYSKKVHMYNSKSGHTTELPPMTEERAGCCAVITGNTIVVMGGKGKGKDRHRSVEAFTLGGYSWRYLPDMNDIRSIPTATVLPTKNLP